MNEKLIITTIVTQLISEHGLPEAGRRLKVRPEVLSRVAAGINVHEGSMALLALRLGMLVPAPYAVAPAMGISSMPPAGDLTP